MKFTPRYIEDNVDVSKTHPLVELAWMVGALLLIVMVIYVVLGVATEVAADKIPIRAERWLGMTMLDDLDIDHDSPLQKRLDKLVAALPEDHPLHVYNFSVSLVANPEVNAVALPGGYIVVFSGLLEQAETENEIAMVLAHELGHFAHRDHLKRLGRGLGLTVAAVFLFGEDSSLTQLASNTLRFTESHYSRTQESAADRWALDLLVAESGHAGGAIDFFERNSKNSGSKIPYILASHPHPGARVEMLKKMIQENGYEVRETTILGEDLIEELERIDRDDCTDEAGHGQGE